MPVLPMGPSSAPVHYPESNYAIAKYLDLTKFLSLLQRQSLFMCRMDKLEDQFEGRSPQSSIEELGNWYRMLRDTTNFFTVPISDSDIENKKMQHKAHEIRDKHLYCVNCWNKFENESAALWKIYSGFSKGIMIKSNIENLKASLSYSPQNLYLSEIRYIDFENETIDIGNAMTPKIHKHQAYSYEKEVRLIYEVPHSGWTYDWSKEETEDGVFIHLDLNILIDEIVISPFSPKWFQIMIQDLCSKYNLSKLIRESILKLDY